MFFDTPSQIPMIAAKVSCAIFVTQHPEEITLKNARILTTEENKKSIGIEEVRTFTENVSAKHNEDLFLIISPADALTEQAQNALLKNLEEPKPHYHYLLVTKSPALLLPTIRSRAQIFFQKSTNKLSQPVEAKEKIASLARNLIAAKPSELPDIAATIAKDKTSPRLLALNVTATAIEILEKSYFKTKNAVFLTKLSKFLSLADALEQNGHVKLHIIADLC